MSTGNAFVLLITRLVPVALPIFGVISVGVFAKTTEPVPVDAVVPVPPEETANGVVRVKTPLTLLSPKD